MNGILLEVCQHLQIFSPKTRDTRIFINYSNLNDVPTAGAE